MILPPPTFRPSRRAFKPDSEAGLGPPMEPLWVGGGWCNDREGTTPALLEPVVFVNLYVILCNFYISILLHCKQPRVTLDSELGSIVI